MKLRSAAWTAALMLLLVLPAGAADAPAPAAKMRFDPAEARDFPPPTDENVAQLWRDFLAHGSPANLAALKPLVSFESEMEELDAASCGKLRANLELATKKVPVSLGAWYVAHLCAEALGDAEASARALDAFTVLSRHALLAGRDDDWAPPIRVVATMDVDAFIVASGQQVAYRHYRLDQMPRRLEEEFALESPDGESLQRYRFDYFDTTMQLMRGAFPPWELPSARREVAGAMLRAGRDAGNEMARATTLLVEILVKDDESAMVSGLVARAQDGDLVAAVLLGQTCLLQGTECAKDAIDALLPFAEARVPDALLYLAFAHARGRGVPADASDARELVAAAGARIGDDVAWRRFAMLWMLDRNGYSALPRYARKPLKAAADAGDTSSQAALAMHQLETDGFTPEVRRLLERAAAGGVSPSKFLLARNLMRTPGEEANALRWLEDAAESEHGAALPLLADALERGQFGRHDEDTAHRWRVEAARTGDVVSMRKAADWLAAGKPPRDLERARRWYEEAARNDDGAAMYSLGMLELAHPRNDGKEPGTARKWLRAAEKLGNADARLELARSLALGKDGERDATEAERLLRIDADAGKAPAQRVLGFLLMFGHLGEDRTAEALRWLHKAADAGDGETFEWLASFTWWGVGFKKDQVEARVLWRRAIEHGHRNAYNELAWSYCTAADAALVDGKAGLDLLLELEAMQDLSALGLDTRAACQAASGDFAAAQATQRTVVDAARTGAANAPKIADAQSRLALYASGKRFVQERSPFAAATN